MCICENSEVQMKVAIIGCGVSGLSSIHHISKEFPQAVIHGLEATDSVGGTWVYRDNTTDEYNIPVMNSMYKNLRTNLPKVIMQFSDYPISDEYTEFMPVMEFLKYIKDYVKHFDLEKYIKFRHYVTNVKKLEDGWEVQYRNLREDKEYSNRYDYVIVCNGHYYQIFSPQFNGLDIFKGGVKHSHFYRKPEYYTDKVVLVIGGGPSAKDISLDVSKTCKNVFISHHQPRFVAPFPDNYHQKLDVQEFTEDSVIFVDGSIEKIDEVIFCTGFHYNCPFLDPSTGVTDNKTHLTYLYKHIVNVAHSTLLFVGVPKRCCAVPLADMQAQYIAALMKGHFQLPTKQEMMDHIEQQNEERRKLGWKVRETHALARLEDAYYESLHLESNIPRVPPVYCKIHDRSMSHAQENIFTYRNYTYRVIDNIASFQESYVEQF